MELFSKAPPPSQERDLMTIPRRPPVVADTGRFTSGDGDGDDNTVPGLVLVNREAGGAWELRKQYGKGDC